EQNLTACGGLLRSDVEESFEVESDTRAYGKGRQPYQDVKEKKSADDFVKPSAVFAGAIFCGELYLPDSEAKIEHRKIHCDGCHKRPQPVSRLAEMRDVEWQHQYAGQ